MFTEAVEPWEVLEFHSGRLGRLQLQGEGNLPRFGGVEGCQGASTP